MQNPSISRVRQEMTKHEPIITQDALCSYLEPIQTWGQAWGLRLWGRGDRLILQQKIRTKVSEHSVTNWKFSHLVFHHRWSKKHCFGCFRKVYLTGREETRTGYYKVSPKVIIVRRTQLLQRWGRGWLWGQMDLVWVWDLSFGVDL